MKIFVSEGKWSGKVNFVDKNNVLLGFDNDDDCCAHGGWFLSDNKEAWDEETFKEGPMDLPGWVFDKEYFRDRANEIEHRDADGAVQFRLVNGDKEKFLTLYNHHNGYYSRGFEWTDNRNLIQEGSV